MTSHNAPGRKKKKSLTGGGKKNHIEEQRNGSKEAAEYSALAPVGNNALTTLNEFCEVNTKLLNSRCQNLLVGSVSVDDTINGYKESMKMVVNGLRILAEIHPYIGVAVAPFILVASLDLARRENNRKAIAVDLKMQELMMVFFELRHHSGPNECGKDGRTISERLLPIMHKIEKDIVSWGSARDAYLKKDFMMKTVKSAKYESRLADFGDTFDSHKEAIKLAMAAHTSSGVDAANDMLRKIDHKLDTLLLFRKLETPREKDVRSFIESHGGVMICVYNDAYLDELISKCGDTSAEKITGNDTGRKTNDLPQIRKRLLKELREDTDEMFSRNKVQFEKKLEMQNEYLTDVMHQESSHIISTLLSGAHDRIVGKELRQIWKDMGWKGSVKARNFVLALHDHYTDRANQSTINKHQDDRWALAYIHAAYVQPILEAVDDDGTGYVSVTEVNTFAESRPKDWSLPVWIAFWAVGWQLNMSKYKGRIYSLVQTMFQVLDHVLPSNRRLVDEYLLHTSFWRIELLLRSTRSIDDKKKNDPDLARITESYSAAEEDRIHKNLRGVSYELDSPAVVSLVTGEGRIERYIFPLIYLLLKRHLEVLKLTCKHVLDIDELPVLNKSLVSVLMCVDDRVKNLEAIFKQTQLDVQGRFANFAFGLFQLSYGDQVKRVPIQNTLAVWDEDTMERKEKLSLESIKSSLQHIPRETLKYGVQDAFQATDYSDFEPRRLNTDIDNPLQGTWSGHCTRSERGKAITFLTRLSFRLTDQTTLVGKGEDYSATFNFIGNAVQGSTGCDFTFSVVDQDGSVCRTCTGSLNSDTDMITAAWSDRLTEDDPDAIDHQSFTLRRTPGFLYRYRYTPTELSEDRVRARWSFACKAVLHEVQAKMWSRKFSERRFDDRKRFVTLSTRDLVASMNLTPQMPLSLSEHQQLEYLRKDLDTSEARFYHALAEFQVQKLSWHPVWCDWCERRIIKCRILCLDCIADDLSDNINLCGPCIDKTPTKRGFSHNVSHSMLMVERTLHDCHLAQVVERAKVKMERAKGLLRGVGVEEQSAADFAVVRIGPHETGGLRGHQDPIMCVCCMNPVATPCWACVECSCDMFICHACAMKGLPPLSTPDSEGVPHAHSIAHPLIRIRDSSDASQNASTEAKLSSLQQRLVTLGNNVSEGILAIDNKLEERMGRLEVKMERVETRLETLETLLKQIVAQTLPVPSAH